MAQIERRLGIDLTFKKKKSIINELCLKDAHK